MLTVNMLDAKTRLSRLVQQVENGEDEVIIARNGRPAAKLVPIGPRPGASRRLGLLAGRYAPMTREAFDADNETIAALFGATPR